MQTDFTRPSMAATDAAAHDSTLFSRASGLLSQAGNADSELKTRVGDDAADDFRRLARSLGLNTSEFLRIMVLTRLYGVNGVARMAQEHMELVAGSGLEKAQEGAAL